MPVRGAGYRCSVAPPPGRATARKPGGLPHCKRPRPVAERGYALLIILLLFSLLALTLAEAAPGWITAIQRQREQTAIDYARQYVMGIRRYYHKFGSYPPNLDRLEQTNDVHYLRRAWPDPLVKSGKWYFIHPGDLIAPKVKGVPGEGGALGGTGTTFGGQQSGIGGQNSGLPGAFGNQGPAAGIMPQAGMNSLTGTPAGGLAGAAAAFSLPQLHGGSIDGIEVLTGYRLRKQDSGFAGVGAQIGGGPIIGVAIPSNKPAVHEFNGKDRPDDWLFVYDPAADRTVGGAMPQGPVPPSPGTGGPSGNPSPTPTPGGPAGGPTGGSPTGGGGLGPTGGGQGGPGGGA